MQISQNDNNYDVRQAMNRMAITPQHPLYRPTGVSIGHGYSTGRYGKQTYTATQTTADEYCRPCVYQCKGQQKTTPIWGGFILP